MVKKDTLSLSQKYVWSTRIQAESVLGLGQQRPNQTQKYDLLQQGVYNNE
jgi:hypothetical protein